MSVPRPDWMTVGLAFTSQVKGLTCTEPAFPTTQLLFSVNTVLPGIHHFQGTVKIHKAHLKVSPYGKTETHQFSEGLKGPNGASAEGRTWTSGKVARTPPGGVAGGDSEQPLAGLEQSTQCWSHREGRAQRPRVSAVHPGFLPQGLQ